METEERIKALEAQVKDIDTAMLYVGLWTIIVYGVAMLGVYV